MSDELAIPHKNVAVIFAGGGGKRLWPISTEEHPKQLNSFFAEKPFIVSAYERALQSFPKEHIVLVIHEGILAQVKELLAIPEKQIIIQPHNMDTAVAMGMTALYLDALYPNSTAVIFYSDHIITDIEHFSADIRHAVHVANTYSCIVAIGTIPLSVNTQYGYIKKGKQIDTTGSVFALEEFVEKPDEQKANEYIQLGYLWNTGLYVWQTSVLLQEIKKTNSELYNELVQLRIELFGAAFNDVLKEKFSHFNSFHSFEKVISEKVKSMIVYQANFRWFDIGNWQNYYDIQQKDENGNCYIGNKNAYTIDVKDTMVISTSKKVGLLGLHDLIIVETKDSLLICHKDYAPKVKDIVGELKDTSG